jgi:actin-like ATPase involved in cell morphogenesis
MDYSFFDDALQARFTTQLDAIGVAWSVKPDPMGGNTVRTADDDLTDERIDSIEAHYDVLFGEQAELAETQEGWITKRVAGVQVTLTDGRQRTIGLDPHLSNRLLEHFSAAEVAELVSAIAESLSRDYDGPLCQFPGKADNR